MYEAVPAGLGPPPLVVSLLPVVSLNIGGTSALQPREALHDASASGGFAVTTDLGAVVAPPTATSDSLRLRFLCFPKNRQVVVVASLLQFCRMCLGQSGSRCMEKFRDHASD